jgi:hypothetical protein
MKLTDLTEVTSCMVLLTCQRASQVDWKQKNKEITNKQEHLPQQ